MIHILPVKKSTVIITLLTVIALMVGCSERQDAKKSDILVTEKIISYVQRAYRTNPYTPDAIASHDHNHILSWGGDDLRFDGKTLIDSVDSMSRWYVTIAQFSQTAKSVLFVIYYNDQHRVYFYDYQKQNLRNLGSFRDVHHIEFSKEGNHFLFVAENQEGLFIFVDGEQRFGPLSRCSNATFRVGTTNVLYSTLQRGEVWIFENNTPKIGPFTEVEKIFVSATNRTAIVAKRGEQVYVIVDGKEEGPFEEVRGFSFNPTGRRYGYVARVAGDEQEKVIIDGNDVESFKEVPIPPFFSLNGRSVGFVGKREPPPSMYYVAESEDGKEVRVPALVAGEEEFLLEVNNSIREKKVYKSGLLAIGLRNEGIYWACVEDSGNRVVYFDVDRESFLKKCLALRIPGVPETWEYEDFIDGGEPCFVSENKVSFVALKHEETVRKSKIPIYKVEIEFPVP